MQLSQLDKFREITIQIHDNPDADAIGSGFAIYKYLKAKGKNVRLIYSGRNKVSKSNILLMIDELDIPLEYVEALDCPELLLTVDCQYGQGNVTHFDAQNIAMIDHHNTGKLSDDMAEIRSNLVSCATICYSMLKDVGYDINYDIPMATALYYGLYMDSDHLSEIGHPLERDMEDFLNYDRELINKLKHANFTIDELAIAGTAITNTTYIEKRRMAIVQSKPCDPNILGVIGDFVIQVDTIDVCVTYNECSGGYKISVRSCSAEIAANEIAEFLTADIGSGGGHLDKAGGFISADRFTARYPDLTLKAYLNQKLEEYYHGFDVIRYSDVCHGFENMQRYIKKKVIFGYIKTTDLFKAGTECKVRTDDGDVFIRSGDDIYIMIGGGGEIYPIQKEIFDIKYTPLDAPFTYSFDYPPTVINMAEGRSYELLPYAHQCMSLPGAAIYARPLTCYTKVFTKWNYEGYMVGKEGDMFCFTEDRTYDIYITAREVFDTLYEKA